MKLLCFSIFIFLRLRDNTLLVADGRIKMLSDDQGNCKLIIYDVNHADSGLYFCLAENKVAKAKCAATLKVVGK